MGSELVESLSAFADPSTLLLMLVGIGLGFVVGILPGLGGAVTLALMLPFTFDMEPVQAFAFLLGMWVVTSTTGDMTSVLFGVPGEATSAAAVLDGHPMTKRGEGGRALGNVLFSSTIGALFGALCLLAAIPIMRPLVLMMGPPEFLALTVLGLLFVITLSSGAMTKGLLMAALGLLAAMVGLDPQQGVPRYTFDQVYLWDGIGLIPVVVGLFGGAEVLQIMLSKKAIASSSEAQNGHTKYTGLGAGVRDSIRNWRVAFKSSAIGAGLGLVPGLGGTVSQFIAYGAARQSSKNPEKFGDGAVDGLVAAGATNNSKDAASLIPTVAFGIPAGAGSAVLLGAFLILGINPGPEMLTTNLDVTFSMVWTMILANLIAVAIAFVAIKPITRLTTISGTVLAPVLVVLLVYGAYTASNSFNDIFVMLGAAALGVVCIRWNWPRIPFLLALVLGQLLERYLFLSHSLFGWNFLARPGVLIIVVMCSLVLLRTFRIKRKATETDESQNTVGVSS